MISSSNSQKFYKRAAILEARSAHFQLCSTNSKAKRLHPISSSNQQERCLNKITTWKLMHSYTFHSAPLLVSPFHKRKKGPCRPRLPQQQQHWVHRASYRSKALRTSPLTGLPSLYSSLQASTHHCNFLIAISPCSTWICLRDFEKRNLKEVKLRLRNKQQLAINKFPKVWESLSSALTAHFKVNYTP